MLNLFFREIKKFFKFRTIKLILIILVGWMMICGISSRKLNGISAFDFQIFILKLLGEFFIISFFISFASYVFGLEIDCKTLKIIRSKQIPIWKIYMAKFLTALTYSALVIFIIYLTSLIFGMMFLPNKGISIDDLNLHYNTTQQSIIFVIKLYIYQFTGSIFIVSISLFITIATQKNLLSIILVPAITMVLNLLHNIKYLGLEWLQFLLPINSDCIYREYGLNTISQRLITLIVYSLIFVALGIIYYKRKEVKI